MSIGDFPIVGTLNAAFTPKRYDIEIYQGDTFEVVVAFKDSNNAVVNLTGCVGKCQFKPDAGGTSVDVPVVLTPATGIATVTLLDTSALSGTYTWDLQLTDAANKRRTYIGGKVNVTEDVTE